MSLIYVQSSASIFNIPCLTFKFDIDRGDVKIPMSVILILVPLPSKFTYYHQHVFFLQYHEKTVDFIDKEKVIAKTIPVIGDTFKAKLLYYTIYVHT